MNIEIKKEETDDTMSNMVQEETNTATTKKRSTVTSRTAFSGKKDYNSRYTMKYSHGEYIWTEQRIFDLIRLYKEYTQANAVYVRNQKPMWDAIATKMRELGHTKCTDNHCHTKYRTLIRQYRVVCDRGTPPEERNKEFPYYDVLSEVYDYTGPKNTETDEVNSEDDSFADDKLSSVLININKDKKEQDRKRLEKLESMHREKMDMFSAFLKNVDKKPNESPSATRHSKRLSASTRKRSAPFCEDFVVDSSDLELDDDSSADQDSRESEQTSRGKRKRNDSKIESTSGLTSLIRKLNEERKQREEAKMCRIEKMHDEKMKMFSAFLDILKKMKK